MPGAYARILFHVTFSTKGRARLITPDLQSRLYPYIGGIIREEKGVLYEIGGIGNHVHLLFSWRTEPSIATLIRRLKAGSSQWVHQTFPGMRTFAWQEGYGVFSVSQSQMPAVQQYIQNQVAHHKERTFEEEFLALLKAHKIEYDERYIWD
ncbi:MAG TPA: IS200/IS605 family transposase [Phycisphaerae bacterium]|nr:IS200/IS605 family transposase [Phycisphaerae bacterium]